MAAKYRHLTEQDRIFLRIMLEKHYPKSKIASILKVDPSTIYREVKRNSLTHWRSGHKFYWSHSAQEQYLKRRKRGLKLEKDVNLQNFVHYRIKRCQRKPRVPKELLITSRPDVINKRDEFGHWECDLMVFKKGVKANLITLRERRSRYLIAIKNQNKEAIGTALVLISAITKIKNYVRSITFDQGSEFKKYEWIKNYIGADIYFCEPASPHQKGCVENGNGNKGDSHV